VLAALSVAALPAQGQGVLFIEKETRGGQTTIAQTQLDKNHIRYSIEGGTFVFDGPKQTARLINSTSKTYFEMRKKDLEEMRDDIKSITAQMKGIPGLSGMPTAATRAEYRQTGTDKVGAWTCTKYEGSVAGQKTSELCTVDPKELGLTPGDLEVGRRLLEFMKELMANEAPFVNGTAQDGFSGVPVRRTTFRNGAVQSVTEVTEVRKQSFPASTFEVPAGYRKDSLPVEWRR
jgi:hypothetical protein